MYFIFKAYEDVFKGNFPFIYRIFFYLYGKNLIHIYQLSEAKVGFALFRSGPIHNIYLCSFGILNQFRGKGLAKNLLGQSLNHWKNKGFKTSSLYVLHDNKIAIRVYESLGFLPIHCQDDLIYMVNKL